MEKEPESDTFSIGNFLAEFYSSPINVGLLVVLIYMVYKLVCKKKEDAPEESCQPADLPPLKKQDMTLEELRKYDGRNEEGRVLVAVNGKIFDVTKGKRFYGPGGPYEAFAGRDATRGLATFSVEVQTEDYDDLSDLNSLQMESVREWELQFEEKYHYVGRLLKPGEEATDYSDEEDTSQDQGAAGEPVKQEEEKKSD